MRRVVLEQDFAMILHTQKQIDAVKTIPHRFRILRMDATGNLVRIPKNKREYPRLLSHFMQLKDLRDIGKFF